MNKLLQIPVSVIIAFILISPVTGQKNNKETVPIFVSSTKQNVDFSKIDAYVLGLKYDKKMSFPDLTAQITKNASTKMEKARAIFIWLANNIAYDTNYKVNTKEEALKQQKGVCQAYSALFQAFCDEIGLECVTIPGDSKQYYYEKPSDLDKGGHAWNVIKVEGDRWLLADATWGAGHVNGRTFIRRLSPEWFDPSPSILIFSHFPQDAQWQLLKSSISRDAFLALPPLYPNLCLWGLNAEGLFSYFLNNKKASFPGIYFPDVSCTIIDMPISKELKKGETYQFEFILPENNKIALISNSKDFTQFQQEGNKHTCSFTPNQSGKVMLGINQKGQTYNGVFEFTVK